MLDIINQPHELDRHVRDRLAGSLNHIFERTTDVLPLEPSSVEAALKRIRSQRVNPSVFARYFDLVFAVSAEDWGRAERIASEVIKLVHNPIDFEILPYSKEALGDDYERYPRLVFASFSDGNPMSTPEPKLFEAYQQKIHLALDIVRLEDPSIAEEIDELISRIIVAERNSDGVNSKGFGGVTSLMVWGAMFVNANHYSTLPLVVTFLVHEVTHAVLFGDNYGTAVSLVQNPAEDSFPSPLRSDLRPMDGIFHATLVCARVALFLRQWVDNGRINSKYVEWANLQWKFNSEAFSNGLGTIRKHGCLSDRAWELLERGESEIKGCA